MELTRKHKLLLGVVGVGLISLTVDRFVLTSSAPASAGAAPVVPAVPRPPADAQAQAPAHDGAADRLQRLESALPDPTPENTVRVAEAFQAPASWQPEAARKGRAEQPARSARESELADRFRLTSVFAMGPGYACINGTKLTVGAPAGDLGVRLISIEPPAGREAGAAVIEYRGQQLRLTMGVRDENPAGTPRK